MTQFSHKNYQYGSDEALFNRRFMEGESMPMGMPEVVPPPAESEAEDMEATQEMPTSTTEALKRETRQTVEMPALQQSAHVGETEPLQSLDEMAARADESMEPVPTLESVASDLNISLDDAPAKDSGDVLDLGGSKNDMLDLNPKDTVLNVGNSSMVTKPKKGFLGRLMGGGK
ncbi:MAG: hypothetical protein COU35_03395 [Candidatus Magasanikbacteria bacterium CG10_big_fil_rev_8_21_14_0_10_47_10]|uniref:Uncharacterized protein n=1 Tax=Candidatus Magasanikbacteria bacterium CG10_big_fil_rev_8_21_14_0_10_47_10 TaxID=1974652 RepID=A0A2H0TQ93_9BACT|nr:MAG: hypothetical protein COU35_03395 [Candidatus Magasanikbacteria bacterium CG10_big_fil_rev_8_21_14_0_10_47_10]